MSISVQCTCGRTLQVKDELAGRKGRCPKCGASLTIPQPEAKNESEDEALKFLLDDSEEDSRPSRPEAKERGVRREEERRSPAPPPQRAMPTPESKPAARVRPPRTPTREKDSGRGSVSINPAIVTGCLMMLGAAIWFFWGLSVGILYFYPPVLFILGIGSVIRGFSGEA